MYNVLYVDDEPALLEIAKLILEQQGEFTLTTITSAIEALTMMRETGYDAVISDYQMPVMDGIVFLKETRAIFGDLPFILFTGKGREEVVIEAINNGADSYIQKGGDPRSQFAELAHKIRNAVERKRIGDALKQDETRFETLVTFYQMTPAPLRELITFAIEKAVELTASSIGYLACVNDDETVLTMHAWSAEAMKECDISKKPLEYSVDSTGLWGEAIRQRRPVITNDYAAPSPLKGGYPPGHLPISRHMNIPVFDGTHIVMVVGVGNKRTGYDDRDVRELSLLMHGLWNVIKERRAEGALRKSEEQYRMLAENSLDMIYRMSLPEGRYDYVSPASLALLGYSPEEFYHNPLLVKTIIHPAWRDYFKQMWTRLLAGDVPPSYEYQIVHKCGDLRWMNQRNMPIRDREGRLIALEGVVTDVTGNKQAEEALRRSTACRMRMLLST